MANINLPNSKPSSVLVPPNYPMEPAVGKISLLFEANKTNFYHKFNAKDYDNGNILFGSNQPYIYTYPDDSNLRKSGGRAFPSELGVNDLIRVSKFITSGRGILFVGTQFLLQRQQPFDETNLYNPTEVILSTAAKLTGGLLSTPKRHIDKSAGLLGGLAALVGISISRGSPPPSTVAGSGGSSSSGLGGILSRFLIGSSTNRESDVLPIQNYGNAAGLLRAKTALKAKSILETKLGGPQNTKNSIFGFIKNLAKSMFPQVLGSDTQNGIDQRADEKAYDLMFNYYNNVTTTNKGRGSSSGLSIGFMGVNIINFKNPSKSAVDLFSSNAKKFKQKYFKFSESSKKIYEMEYPINTERSQILDGPFKEKKQYQTAEQSTKNLNENLKKMIEKFKNNSFYKLDFNNKDTRVFSSGESLKTGYEKTYDSKNTVESEYKTRNIKTLDSTINSSKNYGFAGFGRPDKINTLIVLDKNRIYRGNEFKGYTEWKPYEDDLIAFFFYDVVNEKYIPFRCTVKSISESNNASWEELKFMNRGDALYSYSGFTRNLGFSFTVVVNSIIELHPVWNRINYLASSVKPSSYTKIVQKDGVTNRFMVPPMFMLTIGDLYKYQPIVITTVVVNIPENAIWETFSESSEEDWSYMSDIIKTSIGKDKIGQLPREAEISITCNILEKERAIVGGNHFGHAPLNTDETSYLSVPNTEYLKEIGNFSKNIRSINPYSGNAKSVY